MTVDTTTPQVNLEEARRFLDVLYAGAVDDVDYIVGTRNEGKGWPSTSLAPSRTEQMARLLTNKAAEGHESYIRNTTLNRHLERSGERGGNEDTAGLFALWLDIDGAWGVHRYDGTKTGLRLPLTGDEALEPLRDFHPSVLIDSGGGFYAVWLLAAPLRDYERIEALLKRWSAHWRDRYRAAGLHLDRTKDAARVFRLPGTLNHKFPKNGVGPARPVAIVSMDQTRRFDASDIEDWLPDDTVAEDPPAPIDLTELGSSDYALDVLRELGTVGHRIVADAVKEIDWTETSPPGDDRLIDVLRPGGSSERSVTIGGDVGGEPALGRVQVWSEQVSGIEPGHYTVGTFLAAVRFGGDVDACARWLEDQGIGLAERPVPTWDDPHWEQFSIGGAEEPAPPGADLEASVITSWEPIDLRGALTGEGPPPPTVLRHARGHHLLYAGRSHWFIGASESCKSWGAQAAVAEVLTAGGDVFYIDYEDDERGVVSRLVALGVPEDRIVAGLCYVRPNEPLIDRQGRYTPGGMRFHSLLAERPWVLGIVDGVTEAMATEGLDPNDNSDAALFNRRIMRPIADEGAAAVAIDHQPKNAGETGRFAIGAQHKLSGLTGAAYRFETQRPFGRAMDSQPNIGIVKVTVSKDRPGYVRGRSPEGTVALFRLTSWPDGGVDAELVDAVDLGDEGADMVVALAVLQHLDTYEGESSRRLEDTVAGNSATIRAATKWLVNKGWVRVEKQGQRHAHYLTEAGRREGLNG